MVNIRLITVGNLKEEYLKNACNEYKKRLGAFCKFEIIELNEYRLSDNPSDKEIENALNSEGEIILQKINSPQSYNIAMCIEGKQMSSEKFANLIEEIPINGKSKINFIIGSSYGISSKVKNSCDYKMSMSEMTFPHQLARVMLSEQIYRAFMIKKGNKYHK